jgi:hypothetical protein
LGNSVSVLHIYSLGPLMEPPSQDFGWSRAQVAPGITIANVDALLVGTLGPYPDHARNIGAP